MLIVVVDPEQKNVVRGVFKLPDGMSYDAAEAFIQAAYAKAAMDEDNRSADEFLPEEFSGVSFITVEV